MDNADKWAEMPKTVTMGEGLRTAVLVFKDPELAEVIVRDGAFIHTDDSTIYCRFCGTHAYRVIKREGDEACVHSVAHHLETYPYSLALMTLTHFREVSLDDG